MFFKAVYVVLALFVVVGVYGVIYCCIYCCVESFFCSQSCSVLFSLLFQKFLCGYCITVEKVVWIKFYLNVLGVLFVVIDILWCYSLLYICCGVIYCRRCCYVVL